VRKLLLTTLSMALVLVLATGAMALDAPPYKGRVNDLANMMSPATRKALESRLADLERTDSSQVTVLTIPSLEGDSIEDFSIRVAEAWKVGQKGTDNGVILLVSKADRKIRIEVGYGLEGVLTDILAGQIIVNVITPRFKQNDFDGGFTDGVAAISGAVRGEYTAEQAARPRRSKRGILPLLIIPMFIIIGMTEMFGKRRRHGQFGEGQAEGQTRGRSGVGSTMGTLFLLSMLGGGRGGGGGGFGGGGGGFGGFGGGGFGGGGASGGW